MAPSAEEVILLEGFEQGDQDRLILDGLVRALDRVVFGEISGIQTHPLKFKIVDFLVGNGHHLAWRLLGDLVQVLDRRKVPDHQETQEKPCDEKGLFAIVSHEMLD